MDARQAIRHALGGSEFIVKGYLEDLTESELLVRPVPGANHIAWQLGHMVMAENMLINSVCPGAMPALPAGFQEQHGNDTAGSDDPAKFRPKAEYLQLYAQQRAATLLALDKLTDTDLDQPAPEKFRSFCPTVADMFLLQGNHGLMHAGQWAVIRRKLGRKPLF